MNESFVAELSAPYPLTAEQIDRYQQDGFIKLKDVFSAELLDFYGGAIEREVRERSQHYQPLAERNTYGKAFLQIGNLWEVNETIKQFCLAKRLGRLAAQLMKVDGVRMYHDQALFKESGGGFTPWHADQFYWPLSNNNSITAWIPLQVTPLEMGPLSFCVGSQNILIHRDLAISDESEEKIGRSLRDYPQATTAFELGEISFHSGWTFHRAGPNQTDRMRSVMTVIMMEDGIRYEPVRPGQEREAQRFFPTTPIGAVIDDPLTPVIYRRDRDEAAMLAVSE
jgi:ectoine hydroxylase-related dioxygenase (phytanoyl-CoA dioxygenase family)